MELANRVSTFILVMGIALIGLFVLSTIAQDTQLILLVVGLLLVGLSLLLDRRYPRPEKPRAERFRLVNKKKVDAPGSGRTGNQPRSRRRQSGGAGKRNEKKSSDNQEQQ